MDRYQDNGPWRTRLSVGKDGRIDNTFNVYSDDFKYDVAIRVNGDFESNEAIQAYAEMIVEKLNRPLP